MTNPQGHNQVQLVVSNISIFINSKATLILPGYHSSHHNQGVEHIHCLFQDPSCILSLQGTPALWETLLGGQIEYLRE